MQIFETVNWLFNKVMYSFDFINYNKLHKITCYIQQSCYFQVLCDFMEFSRVDEWKSDIQIHLKLYTEQSSGFEEAHYRQVRVSWWYQQRRWRKGRKASKFLRNYRNIQQMRKKKQTIPVHTACWQKAMTKSGPTRYLEYHRSYPIPTYFVTKGLLHWGQKCHLLLRSQINFKIPNKTTHDRNLKCL